MKRDERILIFTLGVMCGFVIAGWIETRVSSPREGSIFYVIGMLLLLAYLAYLWLTRGDLTTRQRIVIFSVTVPLGFILAAEVETYLGNPRRGAIFLLIGLSLLFAHLGYVSLKKHPRTKK